MKKETFEKAVEKVLDFEGEVTVDTGGFTKYGISKNAFPDVDIANLTKEQAKDIYYKYYWQAMQCEYMPSLIAFLIFDIGVNMGKRRAGRFLQETINKILDKPILKVDGIIGVKTVTGLSVVARTGKTERLAMALTIRRMKFYNDLAKRAKYALYLRGWINRSIKAFEFALNQF